MDEIIKFKGEVVRQLYPNPLEDSDGDMYRIYAVNPTENDDGLKYNKYGNVAIKGTMYKKLLYKEYNIHAVLVKDGYGYGYEVKQIFEPKPETQDEIKRFLGDILTPMQADEVYNTYPDIIDIVMEDRADEIDLDKLYNIGKVRIKIITDKIERNFKFIDISTKLIDYGLKHKDIKQIYEMSKYNSDIVNDFKENPYKYMCDILRYRFNRADAKIMRVDPEYYDSYERLKYAVHYIINDKNNDGDTILNYDRVRTGLQEIDYRLLSVFDLYDEIDGVKYTEKGITTESMYEMEKYIYQKLKSANDNIRKWDVDLDEFKGDSGFELTSEQSQAVEYTATKNAHVLVGFGGTGKSFTTKTVCDYLDSTKKSYALMSPTGVASDVLSEHTGRETETIHRAMKYHPFKGFRLEQFYVDYVIMDELSMVDTWLFYNVLLRIDFSQTKLLLIGDSGQLSSVGSGTILYDIVSNNLLPVTTLTKVFRYDSGGMAQINTDTRNGKDWLPRDNEEVHVYGEDNDFIYYNLDGEEGLEKLIDVYMMLLEDNPPEDIRVMTAYKIKQYGSNRINNILQKLSNPKTPDKKSIKVKNTEFIEGDMVIHKKNNYEIKGYMLNSDKEDSDYEVSTVEIFNGKRGRIKSIDNNIIHTEYPRRVVCYNTKEDEIFELKLSYASSIHSSQGAQCKNVILFVPSDHSNMITSNLLYTGLSRGQERVILIGEKSTIREGLKRSVNLERETNLRYLAQGIYDEN